MKSYLAKLGEFSFSIDQANFDSLKRSFSFGFHQQERLGNFTTWQSTGKWAEEMTLEGSVLIKKMAQIDPLIEMAKRKKPVILVTGFGELVGKVILLGLDLNRSFFLKDGIFLKQDFTLKMARFYD